LVAFNFFSAQGCKGAPPFGNSMGLQTFHQQTPEMSGTDPEWAGLGRAAQEKAQASHHGTAKKSGDLHRRSSSVLASSSEIGHQSITLDRVLEWIFRTPKISAIWQESTRQWAKS